MISAECIGMAGTGTAGTGMSSAVVTEVALLAAAITPPS